MSGKEAHCTVGGGGLCGSFARFNRRAPHTPAGAHNLLPLERREVYKHCMKSISSLYIVKSMYIEPMPEYIYSLLLHIQYSMI